MKNAKWALGLVMMFLGLLLTTQFRITSQQNLDPTRMRAEELIAALTDREEELAAAQERIRALEQEVAELRRSLASPSTAAQLERLSLLAGTTEVTGPGVVVTLSETPEAVTAMNRVTDEDVWRVVNELFTAGAEAISVGGVRLSAVTGIRNVGERILVHETMISSPVEIHAIGDPAVLDASLKLRGGVIDLLSRWGIKVVVVRSEELVLPPVRTLPTFRHATPTTSGS
ncbi:uncharacterized protein YlxW (UPF0749 family) [Symbiobacterium terraclitae]|uniref:Uncharacterized protein YlxW (UPF0749 family) n=1 Tax=Symbiobacterium terraclitae TaxID=557451 RepID=A0ABS4JUV8_9FIRM|nr:uncharacterized protein YlxW (UPF0749 family) [Symbiobacterium terraclitae]